MIDVLVPMLGRPEAIPGLVQSFETHAPVGSELVFLLSPGDDTNNKVCRDIGLRAEIMDFSPDRADYARKMNEGYRRTNREWLFLGASDIEFTDTWLSALSVDADVIATNDTRNNQVMRGLFGTHCFVRRTYIDAQDEFLHEGYDHNFVDRELCGWAKHRRRFYYASEAIVPHKHPLWRTAPWDSTYKKGKRHFHQDRELFLSRAHLWGYRGLSPSEQRLARTKHRDIVRQQ